VPLWGLSGMPTCAPSLVLLYASLYSPESCQNSDELSAILYRYQSSPSGFLVPLHHGEGPGYSQEREV
jgi:hypothetical protein